MEYFYPQAWSLLQKANQGLCLWPEQLIDEQIIHAWLKGAVSAFLIKKNQIDANFQLQKKHRL